MSDRFDFSVNLDDLATDAAAWQENAGALRTIRQKVDGDCPLSPAVFSGVSNGDDVSKRYEEFRLAVSDLLRGGEQKFADIGGRLERTRAAYLEAEGGVGKQAAPTDRAGRRQGRGSPHG